jgi:7-cyano-7-deazaguanine synthase
VNAFERLANVATKAAMESGGGFRVHAPLLHLRKSEIIALGLSLGVDYSITSSCYDPSPQSEACGRCDACILRLKGFAENGVEDPIPYQRSARD